jgi:heterodisulfide reductase subunit C
MGDKNNLEAIDINKCDDLFRDQISELSGVNAGLCLHCRSCENGCPFSDLMDYSPNSVLRMIQMGIRPTALECSTIWICVSCNTCAIQCPMAIDIPAIMDSLCHVALKEGVKVAEPDILNFHQEFLNSVEKYGRSHKLEIMLRYKIRKRDWFGDMMVGLKMLGKRKLHFIPSRIKNMLEFKNLFGIQKQERHYGYKK